MPDRPVPAVPAWLTGRNGSRLEASMAASGGVMRIYGPIHPLGQMFGAVSADEFGRSLAELGDTSNLTIHMHSPGGEAFDGLAIMNQLRQHPAEVEVIVDGLAASAASVICMGADVVTMAPGSQMMVHQAAGACLGFASDMETMRAFLDSLSTNAAEQYAAKAGGTVEDWLAAMTPETWYRADEAVAAGLADRVLAPKDAPETPTMRFDLAAMFVHAGRDNAPAPTLAARMSAPTQTPAAPPVAPSTDPKEADAMSDTLLDGLRKQLGLEADADEATVLAANAEALTERAEATPAEPAAPVVPAGMTLVDAQQWDDVRAMAAKGAAASARQSAEDRDKTIAQAISDGKLSRNEENITKLRADWDNDPEMTAKRIADMAVLYPVSKTPAGTPGTDDAKPADVMTEDEAKMIAAQNGIDYRELMSA